MKKIILSLMVIVGLFTITGCGNSQKTNRNNLSCKGNVDFMTDFLLSKELQNLGEDTQLLEDPSEWRIAFPGDYKNDNIENAEIIFIYDKNNKLNGIQGKNVYTKSVSSQITDEQVSEMNGNHDGNSYKTYKKNNQVILEYTINGDNDFVKAFNAHYPTKQELKNVLEEKTTLVCN